MKPMYGDKMELLAADTDSFFYKIETEDFYQDMYKNKEYFDMSEYGKQNPIYDETNKKVIGKFKDETGDKVITEFVAIRAKCYAYKTDDNNVVKKLKGISKPVVKNNVKFENYYNCVMNNEEMRVSVNAIRTKELTNYSITQNKLALSNKDDKRVWFGTKSPSYGHYKI
jgi:hypothetical protein